MIIALFGPIFEIIIATMYLDDLCYFTYEYEYICDSNSVPKDIAGLALASCSFLIREWNIYIYDESIGSAMWQIIALDVAYA